MIRRFLEGQGRGRSLVISAISGLTLLLLALTVFAVASQARSLSAQAEQSVQTVENLRVVSLARSEISIASRIVSAAPESTAVVDGAIENANAALNAVQANFDERTTEETLTAFEDLRTGVDHQAEIFNTVAADDAAFREAEVATGEAFSTLSDVMRGEQLAAIEGLEADNDLMNLIATISTFTVAFVVPSAALFVFQALRSAPRELRTLRLEHERLGRRSRAMATTVSKEAKELRTVLAKSPMSISKDALARRLMRFEHIGVTNGAPTALRNEPTDVNNVLSKVVEQFGASTVEYSPTPTPVTVADSRQLEIAVTELIANALEYGEAPHQVSVGSGPNEIEISVIDSGNGVPEATLNAIINEQEYALRQDALDGTFGYGLLAARQALEAMGGALRYERRDDKTVLLGTIPKVAPKKALQENVAQAA